MKVSLFFGLCGVLFIFLGTGVSHGQSSTQTIIDTILNNQQFGTPSVGPQAELTVTPNQPSPGEEVVLYFDVFGTTIDTESIVWYENDTVIDEQRKRITVRAGSFGESKEIRVTARSFSGEIFSESVTLAPAFVDLFYDAANNTPLFYKGASLVSRGGSFTLYAIPNIPEQNSTLEYEFNWYVGNILDSDQSGFGRNSFTYEGNLLSRPQNIRVDVLRNGTVVGTGETIVDFEDPLAFVYEDSPLYGVLSNRALMDSIFLESEELPIRVFPYFFSFGTLEYTWRINGEEIRDLSNADGLVFGRDETTSGISDISAVVRHIDHFSQRADIDFTFSY